MQYAARAARRLPVRLAITFLALALGLTFMVGDREASAIDGPVDVVYIARGFEFADSMSGSVLAALSGKPVLFVPGGESDEIPAETVKELERLEPGKIVIFGGPDAVSDGVEDALANYATTGKTERLEGLDRFGTAAAISKVLPSKVNDSDLLDGLDSSLFLQKADLQDEVNGQDITVPNADLLDGLDASAFAPAEYQEPFFVQLEVDTLVPLTEHGPLTVGAVCRTSTFDPAFTEIFLVVKTSVDGAYSTEYVSGDPATSEFGTADGWVRVSNGVNGQDGQYRNPIDSGSATIEHDGVVYVVTIDAESVGAGVGILGQECTVHGLLTRYTATTGLTPGAEPAPPPPAAPTANADGDPQDAKDAKS